MQPEDRDPAYLWDMLDTAKDIAEIVSDKTRDDWVNNKTLRMAVERGIEIIGEAARRVSRSYQDSHPEIPWRDIIGQRNILAHDYGKIDYDLLYKTATQDITRLIEILPKLLPSIDDE